jgi:hypothetical protein
VSQPYLWSAAVEFFSNGTKCRDRPIIRESTCPSDRGAARDTPTIQPTGALTPADSTRPPGRRHTGSEIVNAGRAQRIILRYQISKEPRLIDDCVYFQYSVCPILVPVGAKCEGALPEQSQTNNRVFSIVYDKLTWQVTVVGPEKKKVKTARKAASDDSLEPPSSEL